MGPLEESGGRMWEKQAPDDDNRMAKLRCPLPPLNALRDPCPVRRNARKRGRGLQEQVDCESQRPIKYWHAGQYRT